MAAARLISSTRSADAGSACAITCSVLFFYDIYPEGRKILADIGVNTALPNDGHERCCGRQRRAASSSLRCWPRSRASSTIRAGCRRRMAARRHRGGVAFPGRGQHEVIHRRSGAGGQAREASWVPVLQRTVSRCAAPGHGPLLPLIRRHRQIQRRQKPRDVLPATKAAGRRVVAPAERKSVIRSRRRQRHADGIFVSRTACRWVQHRRRRLRTQRAGQRNIAR